MFYPHQSSGKVNYKDLRGHCVYQLNKVTLNDSASVGDALVDLVSLGAPARPCSLATLLFSTPPQFFPLPSSACPHS